MSSLKSSLLSILTTILIILSTTATAKPFNVTRLLGRFPSFSSFNDYLTRTNLSAEINLRQSITVLAVDNDVLANANNGLSGRDEDGVKDILRLHVLLDYFDMEKLRNLQTKPTTVATLLHASGRGDGMKAFLNVTTRKNGDIVVRSASTRPVKVMRSVGARPYNISVLQVNRLIIPKGNDASPSPGESAPAGAPEEAPSPPTEPPVADAPEQATAAAEAEAGAGAPVAEAPASNVPDVDAPEVVPEGAPEGVPEGAPSPEENESSAGHVDTGRFLAVSLFVAVFAYF